MWRILRKGAESHWDNIWWKNEFQVLTVPKNEQILTSKNFRKNERPKNGLQKVRFGKIINSHMWQVLWDCHFPPKMPSSATSLQMSFWHSKGHLRKRFIKYEFSIYDIQIFPILFILCKELLQIELFAPQVTALTFIDFSKLKSVLL